MCLLCQSQIERLAAEFSVHVSWPFAKALFHPDWFFEIKWDGFRSLTYLEDGHCRLVSRNGNEFKSFPALNLALPLECGAQDAVLDGEIVCLDNSSRPPLRLRQDNQFRLARTATHTVDSARDRCTDVVLVASRSFRLDGHWLGGPSHDWIIRSKRRIRAERNGEARVLPRTRPYHGSARLKAEKLIAFRVGNARLNGGRTARFSDVDCAGGCC